MNAKIRTCFISAPAGANLKILREILDEKGVRVIVPEKLPPGSNWSAGISSILSTVDLVVGVLTRARRSDSVLFELGQASALGRQIVLFTPPKFTAIPFDLQRFLVIRTSPSNREAISFALDQLLAAPTPELRPTSPRESEVHSLGESTNVLLREVREATAARQGQKLEALVTRAIRESGVDVIAEAPGLRERFDLAIWSDALQPLVGNPLLIEIKVQVLRSEDANRAVQRLSAAISSSGAAWGLLLYGEGPESEKAWKSLPPNVLVMSLPTLIKEMEYRPFVDIIRDQRNRRVHGVHS
jgi:hypothetical protein